MPVKKDSVNRLVVVRFQEPLIVDFRKQAVKVFDVTSEGNRSFSSDFITNGLFDHEQYCKCLLETAFSLPESQLSSFLDYQCAQLVIPYHWLFHFKTLLDCNKELVLTYQEKLRGKLNLLIQLLEEKEILYSTYVRRKELLFFKFDSSKKMEERFNIVKVKKELNLISTSKGKRIFLNRCLVDYLQEVKDDEAAPFVKSINREIEYLNYLVNLNEGNIGIDQNDTEMKKVIFKGTPIQLADLIGQMKDIRNEKGDLLFDGSTMDYTRYICNAFCQSDGSPFMENSIRKYLTDYQNGKRHSKKNRIDISGIKLSEE